MAAEDDKSKYYLIALDAAQKIRQGGLAAAMGGWMSIVIHVYFEFLIPPIAPIFTLVFFTSIFTPVCKAIIDGPAGRLTHYFMERVAWFLACRSKDYTKEKYQKILKKLREKFFKVEE